MTEPKISSSNIRKLAHSIKEIRERALESLYSKLKYGVQFENELPQSKELLQILFAWFERDNSEHYGLILEIMSMVLKLKSAPILIKFIGDQILLRDFEQIKSKINPKYLYLYNEIINIIKAETCNTEQDNSIPKLDITATIESERNMSSNINENAETTKRTIGLIDASNAGNNSHNRLSKGLLDGDSSLNLKGVKVYLLPWRNLCESDVNTIALIESSLLAGDALERSTRFFIDVLLKDFPAEVFLNRPTIVQCIHGMINKADLSVLSMEALDALACALHTRIHHLCDSTLARCKRLDKNMDPLTNHPYSVRSNLLNTGSDRRQTGHQNTLKQLSLPMFCLDTIYIVLNALGQGTSLTSKSNRSETVFKMKEGNVAITLCVKLGKILQEVVTDELWKESSANKLTQEIVQKVIVVLRSCGDVLNKFRTAFVMWEMCQPFYRISYLRLLSFCTDLARWCNYASLIPHTFTSSLFNSITDVPCAAVYPLLHNHLENILKNWVNVTIEDKECLQMYQNTVKICNSMNSAIGLLQNYNSLSTSPSIIQIISESLPSLEFYKNANVIAHFIDVFCVRIKNWTLNLSHWKHVRNITVKLLSHCDWVQISFYSAIRDVVAKVLSGSKSSREKYSMYTEESLRFLLDEAVLTEVCLYGLDSPNENVKHSAEDIMQNLLRGKLMMSDVIWNTLLEAVLPVLPILHTFAAHDEAFGKSIVKTLDVKIGQLMLIPEIDLMAGNIRLLFTKCFSSQMEGSLNLIKYLNNQQDGSNLLPKIESVRADILTSALQSVLVKNFNIVKVDDPSFYQEESMLQVLRLLKFDKRTEVEYESIRSDPPLPGVDPSFRKSALAQLAVMLQQPSLHKAFLQNNGCEMIAHYLRASLTAYEYTTFPESAISCISMLNSLCCVNTNIRHWASEQKDLILNVIRALLLFPNDESFVTMSCQVLYLLAFSQCAVNTLCDASKGIVSLPYCIAKRTNAPFPSNSHSKESQHRIQEKKDYLMSDPSTSSYLRIYWCTKWYGGADRVVRWPYIPDNEDGFSSALMMTNDDLNSLKATCPIQGCVSALYQVQNASSHRSVDDALDTLVGYILLSSDLKRGMNDFDALPWHTTLRRFITSPPASPKDSLLLLRVTKFLVTFLNCLIVTGCREPSVSLWIVESVLETSRGITAILKFNESDSNWSDDHDHTPYRLRQNILHLLSGSSVLYDNILFEKHTVDFKLKNNCEMSWSGVTEFLSQCLTGIDLFNFYSLAYVSQIVECLMHLTHTPVHGLACKYLTQSVLVKALAHIVCVSYIGNDYHGYKGYDLVQNSFIALCHLLEIALTEDNGAQYWMENWISDKDDSVLSACMLWHNSQHSLIQALSFKILSGLASVPSNIVFIEDKATDSDANIIEIVINVLVDLTEASFVREQAAILLSNLLASKNTSKEYLQIDNSSSFNFFSTEFYSKIFVTLTKVCLKEQDIFNAGDNISLDALVNRDQMEVALSKNDFIIPMNINDSHSPRCSIGLVTAICDVIYNILLQGQKIPETISDLGNFRILFRCVTLQMPMSKPKLVMLASTCRVVYLAVNLSKKIHSALSDTHDCVSAFLSLFGAEFIMLKDDKILSKCLKDLWKWAFLLMGSLVETSRGYNCVWSILSEAGMLSFLESLLISISDNQYKDVRSSAIHCMVNILQGSSFENTPIVNIESILDKTSAPVLDSDVKCKPSTSHLNLSKNNKDGTVTRLENEDNCDAVYSERICMILVPLYKSFHNQNLTNTSQNALYESVAAGLSSLFGVSQKAKLTAVDLGFIQDLIEYLSEIQYSISTVVSPSDISRIKQTNPFLHRLDWTIQLLCNCMTNCPTAKEQCADHYFAVHLNRLWPWCIASGKLRHNTIQMLCVFTNDCPKANQAMHSCVGSRSLLMEVVDLAGKEMSLLSSKRSLATLQGCLQILENVSPHIHCRAVILKSEIFSHLNKLHPAVTKRQPHWRQVEEVWEKLCICLTRYPEGQMKVAESLGLLCALVHQAQGRMLPVLRNCAFNPSNRPRLLGSAELLHLFSSMLTSDRSLEDKLMVCGAIWALAANNHKAKLSLRTAGLASKLTDCLHHLKYSTEREETEQAAQMISYVINLLQ